MSGAQYGNEDMSELTWGSFSGVGKYIEVNSKPEKLWEIEDTPENIRDWINTCYVGCPLGSEDFKWAVRVTDSSEKPITQTYVSDDIDWAVSSAINEII